MSSTDFREKHGDRRFDADVRSLRIRDDLGSTAVPTKISCAQQATLDHKHAEFVRGAQVELVAVPDTPCTTEGTA